MPVIDRENCIHFKTGECGLCSKVCQAGAIDYDQPEEKIELEVGSVVLTPGFEAFDATRRGEFGFGFAPNVLSNVQFERMLSASGPTQRPHPPAQRRQGRPSGWPSSSASARATRAATTTTAPRSAAWPPPRRPSWPRSTSRAWR